MKLCDLLDYEQGWCDDDKCKLCPFGCIICEGEECPEFDSVREAVNVSDEIETKAMETNMLLRRKYHI